MATIASRALARVDLPAALSRGVLLDLALRIGILVFTADALLNAGDERFAGKALGPRNVGILLGFSRPATR